jgi:hypothetical protein
MNKLGRSATVALALAWSMAVPALAAENMPSYTGSSGMQTAPGTQQMPAKPGESAMQSNEGMTGKTGVPPRGQKVAPSTTAGQPAEPKTAETGVPPRGTKVAPSTEGSKSGMSSEESSSTPSGPGGQKYR